jgi:hypothetical protein
MTLGELTDLVCTKVHRNDVESQAEARKYIRSRYQIIWDMRLWRDTLELKTMRGGEITNEFGIPLTDEHGNILYAGLIDQVITMPIIVSRVVACRWGSLSTLEPEALDALFQIDPDRFDRVGEPISFSVISPSGVTQTPGGRPLRLNSSAVDAMYDVTVHGSLGDADQSEVIRMSGTSQVSSAYSYDNIVSLSKDSRTEDLVVQDDLLTPLLTLPRDESERLHQRIHFHSTPRENGEMLILYKRRIKNLNEDSDSTELGGTVDNALLAAAISDMREGERQYTKAAQKSVEVSGLVELAIQDEKRQSGSLIRIIPSIYDFTFGEDILTKSDF